MADTWRSKAVRRSAVRIQRWHGFRVVEGHISARGFLYSLLFVHILETVLNELLWPFTYQTNQSVNSQQDEFTKITHCGAQKYLSKSGKMKPRVFAGLDYN